MGAPTGFQGFASGIGSSFIDLVTSLQNMVQAANTVADALNSQIPHFTTGQMSVDTLVVPGVVRVTGISVVATGATGGIYDATSIAGASATTQVGVVGATAGFQSVNMYLTNGLVYKPGAGQKAALFYART